MTLLGEIQMVPVLQAEQGPFLRSYSCWTRQGCAASPCALLPNRVPEGSALSAHQLYIRNLWLHLLLEGGNQLSKSSNPVSCCWGLFMEGQWGFGVGCTYNSCLPQICLATLPESSCFRSRIGAEDMAVVKMPDSCLASSCCLC